MKQLLFLLLFPCLCVAQYTGNAGQKITLGEQTTADGLVYRGVLNDTALITPFSDTSAYIILDTVNNRFYNYNRATNVWSVASGTVTSVAALTLGTTGTDLSSTVATGTTTPVITLNVPNASASNRGVITTGTQTIAGAKTFSNSATFSSGLTSNGTNAFGSAFYSNNASSYTTFQSYLSNSRSWQIDNVSNEFWLYLDGNVDSYVLKFLQTSGNAEFGSAIIATTGTFSAVGGGDKANDLNITSTGVLTTASSDEKYKYNILPINYGLNTILQLKPVNFQWIKGEENDLGFIAQDVADIIPEAVDTNWNSDLLMRYESIIPILTKAIQEQNALIKALEQRLLILENK